MDTTDRHLQGVIDACMVLSNITNAQPIRFTLEHFLKGITFGDLIGFGISEDAREWLREFYFEQN